MPPAIPIAVFGLMLWAAPVAAQVSQTSQACRMALLLALDVSASVDAEEDQLQRQGLAAALTTPQIEAAFLDGPQRVSLAAFEWSGSQKQTTLLDWTVVDSAATLRQTAAQLALSKRQTTEFPTAIGYAVGYAATLFRRAPDCDVNVLDVSGDGKNNDGFTPRQAYRAFPLDNVIVNGLAIETFGAKAADLSAQPGDITRYYREEVIKGADAFVEVAQGFEDFEAAMRRKLSRELALNVLGRRTPAPLPWPEDQNPRNHSPANASTSLNGQWPPTQNLPLKQDIFANGAKPAQLDEPLCKRPLFTHGLGTRELGKRPDETPFFGKLSERKPSDKELHTIAHTNTLQ